MLWPVYIWFNHEYANRKFPLTGTLAVYTVGILWMVL